MVNQPLSASAGTFSSEFAGAVSVDITVLKILKEAHLNKSSQ